MEKTVGVITPYKRMFHLWVQDNAQRGEAYIQIRHINDVRGRVFDRIEKQVDYYLVDSDVCTAAKNRVRHRH